MLRRQLDVDADIVAFAEHVSCVSLIGSRCFQKVFHVSGSTVLFCDTECLNIVVSGLLV